MELDSKSQQEHFAGQAKQKQTELKESHMYIKQLEQEKSGVVSDFDTLQSKLQEVKKECAAALIQKDISVRETSTRL